MKNKKGFTLIELLAVIVILGILMLIAIPAVTRYIEDSKKETFIKEVNSLVDTVRYGITSGDPKYSMGNEITKTYTLQDIKLEKGKNTIKNGSVVVNTKDNTYEVKVTDEENNYCIARTEISKLTKDNIVSCDSLKEIEYHISKGEYENQKISYKGSNWYVIKESTKADDYVVLLKETVLSNAELGDYAYQGGYNTAPYSTNNSNVYSTSNVKKILEDYVKNKKMTSDLAEVPLEGTNYKIRLITVDELINNLGWKSGSASKATATGNSVPKWVYIFERPVNSYYTMTPDKRGYAMIEMIWSDGGLFASPLSVGPGNSGGVRPVINLSKSAIEE